MTIITNKKIIVLIIVIVLITCMTMPTFAATNKTSIFSKIFSTGTSIINTIFAPKNQQNENGNSGNLLSKILNSIKGESDFFSNLSQKLFSGLFNIKLISDEAGNIGNLEENIREKTRERYNQYINKTVEGLSKNQCTWWAYQRATDYLGYAYPNKSDGQFGTAKNWDNRNTNFESGTTAKVNSIGVYEAFEDGAGIAGHLVYVEAIQDGKVYVSECNWSGNSPNVRVLGSGNLPSKYIYLD